MRVCTVISIFLVFCGSQVSAHVGLLTQLAGKRYQPGDQVELIWEVQIPHNQENWDLFYSLDEGQSWLSIAEDLPVSQLRYTWIVPDAQSTQARVRVVQDNSMGEIDYSAESGSFAIGDVEDGEMKDDESTLTGADNEPELNDLVRLYPNPTVAYVFLEVKGVAITDPQAILYGCDRKEMRRWTFNPGESSWRLDLSSLPGGTYVLHLQVNKTTKTIRRITIL